jgi:GxxExxY protein
MSTKIKPLLHAELTGKILEACFEVINELGQGFLESVYQNALFIALEQKMLNVQAQAPIAVFFRGECVGQFYADLLVEGKVIVELKAVQTILPEHKAQVINYLKCSDIPVGLLVNFGNSTLEYRRFHK